MNRNKSKKNQLFNENSIEIFLKTQNIIIKIKIRTVLYIILELTLALAILKML